MPRSVLRNAFAKTHLRCSPERRLRTPALRLARRSVRTQFVVCAYAAHHARRPASSAGSGSLLSANCARRRITSAALTSACRVNPHATHPKRLLRRLSRAMCPHCEHSCDENLASTPTTVRTAHSAFSRISVANRPKLASSSARFKPRLAATLRPGAATLPLALRVMPRTFNPRARSHRRPRQFAAPPCARRQDARWPRPLWPGPALGPPPSARGHAGSDTAPPRR